MRNAVSPKTFEIITRKRGLAADPQSAGLTVEEAAIAAAIGKRRPPAGEPRRGALLAAAAPRRRAPARGANVVAVLELAGGALQLATVSAAYGKAMQAAGKGQPVSIPPAAIDAGAALLSILRRYRAKR